MNGPPEDKPAECNARLYLADDYGDGTATIRCTLPEGHEGKHREVCRENEEAPNTRNVEVTWEGDERIQRAWWEWEGAASDIVGEGYDWLDMPESFPWKAVWDTVQEFKRREEGMGYEGVEAYDAFDVEKQQAIYEAGTQDKPTE